MSWDVANIPVVVSSYDVYHGGSDAALVLRNTRRCVRLNRNAQAILGLVDGKHSAGQIAAVISARWPSKAHAIEADVRACLTDLEHAGVVAVGPASDHLAPLSSLQPLSILLEIQEGCNLSCRHCYLSGSPDTATRLSGQEVLRIVHEAVDIGVGSIAISGGEPLLHPDCLQVLREANGLVNVNLCTNAIPVSDEIARELSALDRVQVVISLDGADASTHDQIRGAGAFVSTMAGVNALHRHGVTRRSWFRTTLARSNLHQICEIAELANRFCMRGVMFTHISYAGRAVREWAALAPTDEEYLAQYRRLWTDRTFRDAVRARTDLFPLSIAASIANPKPFSGCPMGSKLRIDAQGYVYPCLAMLSEKYRLGCVASNSLTRILTEHSPLLLRMRRESLARTVLVPECLECSWRLLCNGGCMARALDQNGTIWAPASDCGLRQRLYPLCALRPIPGITHGVNASA